MVIWFELSTAYEGDWDLFNLRLTENTARLNWAPLMKVIETRNLVWFSIDGPFELSTAYEGDWDFNPISFRFWWFVFELSTAYEGDWDLEQTDPIERDYSLNWAPLMKVIETVWVKSPSDGVSFELSTAYEGDWDFIDQQERTQWYVWIEHRLWRWLRQRKKLLQRKPLREFMIIKLPIFAWRGPDSGYGIH